MEPSTRALLEEIVDYAGLFPPAELPLDRAIRAYASYRGSRESWMLARFICPVAKLGELEPYHDDLFSRGAPFRFSVLGRGGDDAGAFLESLANDLSSIAAFRRRHRDRVVVDAFEVRFPPALLAKADDVAMTKLLNDVGSLVDRKGPPALSLHYEAPLDDRERAIPALVTALSDHNRTRDAMAARIDAPAMRAGRAGMKLRTGGVTADAFPRPEDVAFVIAHCRNARVPLKFTAGLHHPIRRLDSSVGARAHGFLNVFMAGVFAWAQGIDQARITTILEDENRDSFVFEGDRVSWKGYAADTDAIVEHRRGGVTSFGSCSFDEPREDLRALGLLPGGEDDRGSDV